MSQASSIHSSAVGQGIGYSTQLNSLSSSTVDVFRLTTLHSNMTLATGEDDGGRRQAKPPTIWYTQACSKAVRVEGEMKSTHCWRCMVAEGGRSRSSWLSRSFRATSMPTASDLNLTPSPAQHHMPPHHQPANLASLILNQQLLSLIPVLHPCPFRNSIHDQQTATA